MPEGSFLYCDVSLPVPLDRPFTYSLPETLRHRVKPGCRLIVPFGVRKMTGVALRCHDEPPSVETRQALRLIDSEPVLDEELLKLAHWIANYYCAPLGEVLRGMLPLANDIRSGKTYELTAFLMLHPGSHNLKDVESQVKNSSGAARSLARKGVLKLKREPLAGPPVGPVRTQHLLNSAQQEAFKAIQQAIESKQFRTFLLHGITGSGKTEVYLNAIDVALDAGRGALLLVPEIALTPAMAGQFYARFGDRVAILHSAFTDTERAEQWRRIRAGAASVVVGTRSGVFAPVVNLGLIVVDEEHDGSYKQEETPRYNGRDVAIVRAQAAKACVVLGSATPSLESRYNVERGKYTLLELTGRIEARPMPMVQLIDMRQEFLETRKQATFSRKLLEAISQRLESGE